MDIVVSPFDASTAGGDLGAFVQRAAGATFFHLPEWSNVIEASYGYRPRSLVARRDGAVCGFLPLHEVPKLPWGKCLISSPMAVYGGILADDAPTGRALLAAAKEQAVDLGVRYLELRHIEPVADGDLVRKDLYVTFRRPILPTEDANMEAIPRNQRRSIRIGRKNGLQARLGGVELLDAFYDIYSHSVHNLGSPVFPLRYFRALLEKLESQARILGVFLGDKMLAGVLTFFFRDQVMPFYGGAYKDAYRLSVYDFMYWSLLCHGMENGYKVFDFGRSKKETGSYHFKRHWGFEPEELAYQYFLVRQKTMPDESPANPKFSLPIKVWKRLPLRLTQWIGPRVIQYFP